MAYNAFLLYDTVQEPAAWLYLSEMSHRNVGYARSVTGIRIFPNTKALLKKLNSLVRRLPTASQLAFGGDQMLFSPGAHISVLASIVSI